MSNPIQVVIPVTIDPTNPTVLISLRIDVQNFPTTPANAVISILNDHGELRRFEEIQTEYAAKAIKLVGNASAAVRFSGVSRQTLTKWRSGEK